MLRPTTIHQEIQLRAIEAGNPHEYSPDERTRYFWGVIPREAAAGEAPVIVPAAAEKDPVHLHWTDPATHHLVIVPQSQITRSGECTPKPETTTTAALALLLSNG
ncbi:unnamed protein product [Phaeothamnion confervicola]